MDRSQGGRSEEAFDAARRALGLPPDQPLLIERLPRPRRLFDLSLLSRLPRRGGPLTDLLGSLSSWRFLLRERVWALMPFDIRFF